MNANSQTTVSKWLHEAESRLSAASLSTARLDCLVLLEDETDKNRSWLLAHPEYILQGSEIIKLNTKIAQRRKHIPLAYIRGKSEFYGREFLIDTRVLEPRPESEAIIELLKSLPLKDGPLKIVDVGTGSGALAITAKLEFPRSEVYALDIDVRCLQMAKKNARKHETEIIFRQGNLLEPLRTLDLPGNSALLCNLPYVPDGFHINRAATHEPKLALFGGPDGLDPYRAMFKQTKNLKLLPRYILTESLPPQHGALETVAKTAGYQLAKTDDFIQLFTKA